MGASWPNSIYAISLGSGRLSRARAARLAPTITLAAWTPLASIPVALIAAFSGADLRPSPALISLALASIVILSGAKIFFYQAAKIGQTSAVVAFLAAYPLVSLLVLSAIHVAWPSITELAGVLIIIGGALLLSSQGVRGLNILGILLMISFGIWAVVESLAMSLATPLDMIFWVAALYSLLTPPLLLVAKNQGQPLLLPAAALSLLFSNQWIGYLGLLTFYYGLKAGPDILVITLTSLTPLITAWLCVFFAEERAIPRRMIATFIIVIGAVLSRGVI